MTEKNDITGCLIALSKDKKANKAFLIDASQIGSLNREKVIQISYSRRNTAVNIYTVLKAPQTMVILRKVLVDRDFGGIDALIDGLNSKRIIYNGRGFEHAK